MGLFPICVTADGSVPYQCDSACHCLTSCPEARFACCIHIEPPTHSLLLSLLLLFLYCLFVFSFFLFSYLCISVSCTSSTPSPPSPNLSSSLSSSLLSSFPSLLFSPGSDAQTDKMDMANNNKSSHKPTWCAGGTVRAAILHDCASPLRKGSRAAIRHSGRAAWSGSSKTSITQHGMSYVQEGCCTPPPTPTPSPPAQRCAGVRLQSRRQWPARRSVDSDRGKP